MIALWGAALLYFAAAYDATIYTKTVLNISPSLSEISYSAICFALTAFLLIFSIFQYKKTSLRFSILAAFISIFIYWSAFGLFDLINQMEKGQNYVFDRMMLCIFFVSSLLTVLPVIHAWLMKNNTASS